MTPLSGPDLRSLLDQVSGMAFRCLDDEYWTMRYISASCFDITGYRAEQLVDNRELPFINLIEPADRQRVANEVHYVPGSDDEYQSTYRIRTADGETKWVFERGRVCNDQPGSARVIEGQIVDIADQQHTQEILLAIARAMAEPVGENFYDQIASRIAGILNVSGAMIARRSGDNPDQLTTLSCVVNGEAGNICYRLHGTPCAEVLAGRAGVFLDDVPQRFPDDRLLIDLGIRSYIGVPLKNPEGEPDGLVAVLHQGSLQRHPLVVAALHILASRVSAEIQRDRAGELADRLRQSQRLEAVGQLTGGLAHDFNNLLTVILGNAELLRENLDAAGTHASLVRMIENAAQSGADLISRLLAFSRRQSLAPETVAVNEVLNGMAPMLGRSLGDNVRVDIECDEDLWPVRVDPVQLESAVLNLCLNARDAMSNGGILGIRADNTRVRGDNEGVGGNSTPGAHVRIEVSDSGNGIPAEIVDRIFDPFFTSKQSGHGTGLGLSMVYGFVEQSGGHLTLDTTPGQGTAIALYLPRDENAVPARTTSARSPQTGKRTILVVEDEPEVRAFVVGQLQRLGYTVVAATRGNEALEVVGQRKDIDLLFTDIVMPGGLHGRELAQRILEIRPGMKVLLTTGYSTSNTGGGNKDVGRGTRDFVLLRKPYRRAELERKLRQALEISGHE